MREVPFGQTLASRGFDPDRRELSVVVRRDASGLDDARDKTIAQGETRRPDASPSTFAGFCRWPGPSGATRA